MCAACRDAATEGGCDGFVGSPEIAEQDSALVFEHRRLEPLKHGGVLVDIQPLLGADRDVWIGLTLDGRLWLLDLDRRAVRLIARLPDRVLDPARAMAMVVSRDGRLAAVVNVRGVAGVVLDLETGRTTIELRRDEYHVEQCKFPLAFIERAGRQLLAYGRDWNRLDVVDARTGEPLTDRISPGYVRDAPQPDHYLEYFHCGLAVSPNQRYVVDNGWVWHPSGIVTAWSIDRWLDDNVWESEDGASRRELCVRSYYWDGPLCWLDDAHLAVWGLGDDDPLLPAVRIFDVRSGTEDRWFPGPQGDLVFDRVLIALDGERGSSVWNLENGARLLHDAAPAPLRYHPSAKTFLSFGQDPELTTSRLCGHAAEWNRGVVADLAAAIARDHSFQDLPVLGDALESAGCSDVDLLAHCQHPGPHGGRCWVIDRLRGR